jgi:hypothetical protein
MDLAAVSNPVVLALVVGIPAHPLVPVGSLVLINELVLPLSVAGTPAAIQTRPLYAIE